MNFSSKSPTGERVSKIHLGACNLSNVKPSRTLNLYFFYGKNFLFILQECKASCEVLDHEQKHNFLCHRKI